MTAKVPGNVSVEHARPFHHSHTCGVADMAPPAESRSSLKERHPVAQRKKLKRRRGGAGGG